MPDTIAIIGAGPGLGQAVARRYAREGYTIVLIARRRGPLNDLAAELAGEGATVHAIAADLSDPQSVASLVDQLRDAVDSLDVLYYASPMRGYVPVTDLTSQELRELMPIAVYSLVDLIQAFLPQMLERNRGAILTATGPSALLPLPQLSAASVLATQRNYLHALRAAVTNQGIFVGSLFIGATIEHSAFHTQQEAARAQGRPTIDLPIVEPDHLADLLWNMHNQGEPGETIYPPDLLAHNQ